MCVVKNLQWNLFTTNSQQLRTKITSAIIPNQKRSPGNTIPIQAG